MFDERNEHQKHLTDSMGISSSSSADYLHTYTREKHFYPTKAMKNNVM